jgi:hypothetical protein
MSTALFRKFAIVAVVAVAALGATVHGDASAPTVTITSPSTGDTFYGTFPYTLPVTFNITHGDQGELKSVQELTISAQKAGDVEATVILGPLKPFTGSNACPTPLPAGIVSCSVDLAQLTGTLTFNWQVAAAGSYTFLVSTKHGNAFGTDTVEVAFDLQTIAVEYPAPPAIANAYINSLPSALKKAFTAGARGCVISDIAQNHGQLEKYNPKPGPYNVAMVQQDVRNYSTGCGGPVIP